ncbi:hypothetical protein [Rugamonas sp. DEMB1]|nr:hypothetical protein [Rugamonas sp. DEMB1]WGG51442.1 hypothetical protein QC826_04040 [Rugamonas sp. DEMB1]
MNLFQGTAEGRSALNKALQGQRPLLLNLPGRNEPLMSAAW